MQYAILPSSIKNRDLSSPLLSTFYGLAGPRAPLGVPVWKPFLNRREMVDRDRIRPVPVVFLRLAFSDQLSIVRECQYSGTKIAASTVVVVWLFGGWVVGFVRSRTLPGLSSGVTARSAGVLLDVQRAAACVLEQYPVRILSSSYVSLRTFARPIMSQAPVLPPNHTAFQKNDDY